MVSATNKSAPPLLINTLHQFPSKNEAVTLAVPKFKSPINLLSEGIEPE